MNLQKILVTGGAGFIGSHLVQALLKEGHRVRVLDNLKNGNKLQYFKHPRLDLMVGDVRDKQLVDKAIGGCNIIFHLAAIVGVDEVIQQPEEMIETETIGTANVVAAAISHKVKKIIYSSSSAIYHKLESDFNRENDDPHLINTYAIAKCLNERYLATLPGKHGISTNSIRLFNVYGAHQDDRMVIPRFINQAKNRQAIEVFGNGMQTRDFTHIDDVVKGLSILMHRHDLNGIFNIARGIETSILDLAKAIKKVTNSTSLIQLLDFPKSRITYQVERRLGCTQKLFKHTGFQPQITLSQGLQKLLLCTGNVSVAKAK